MLIVDSQVHIWTAHTPERPWPKGRNKPHRGLNNYSATDLLGEMDEAGVDRAALVPPGWEGERNDLAIAAALAHPSRLAVMAALEVEEYRSPRAFGGVLARSARAQFEALRGQSAVKGLRLTFTIQGDATDDWIWPAAESANLPTMIEAGNQLHMIERIAQRHTGLKVIVDRLGIPHDTRDDKAFVDMDKLVALARFPNVGVKLGALQAYVSEQYPYRSLHQHIRKVYDHFGPQRLFWGTDLTKLPCTYRQAVIMYTEEMPWLSAEDKEWIMGRAFCTWLNWN